MDKVREKDNIQAKSPPTVSISVMIKVSQHGSNIKRQQAREQPGSDILKSRQQALFGGKKRSGQSSFC